MFAWPLPLWAVIVLLGAQFIVHNAILAMHYGRKIRQVRMDAYMRGVATQVQVCQQSCPAASRPRQRPPQRSADVTATLVMFGRLAGAQRAWRPGQSGDAPTLVMTPGRVPSAADLDPAAQLHGQAVRVMPPPSRVARPDWPAQVIHRR